MTAAITTSRMANTFSRTTMTEASIGIDLSGSCWEAITVWWQISFERNEGTDARCAGLGRDFDKDLAL